MIIEIFFTLIVLTVGAIILEQKTKEVIYGIMAVAFLFTLGIGLINGVEVVNGMTIDDSITPNIVEYTYYSYSNYIYGALISAVAIFSLPMYAWKRGWFA